MSNDLLGAHVSIAGGTHEAPPRARAIDATAMQVFSKMANRWAERDCLDDECTRFRAALTETAVRATMGHDSGLPCGLGIVLYHSTNFRDDTTFNNAPSDSGSPAMPS